MRLSHHRRGSGDPLLLIHGIGSQWQVWEPVLDQVAGEREVVAIDLPGFGASERRESQPDRGHGQPGRAEGAPFHHAPSSLGRASTRALRP